MLSNRRLRRSSVCPTFDARSIAGVAASAVVLPPSSASLLMWFDASDSSTITLSGSNVTGWKEKVNNVTWSQATSGNQPVIDTSHASVPLDVINFSAGAGSTRFLSGSSVSLPYPMTIFIAALRGVTGTYSALGIQTGTAANVHSAGGTFAVYGFSTNTINRSVQLYSEGDYAYYNGSLGGAGFEGEVVCYVVPSTTASATVMERNGSGIVETASATLYTANPAPTAIGSSDTLYKSNGSLCEVLVYNSALDATARAAVVSYLNTKWVLY